MGLAEHSSDKVDLSPGGWLLIPAAEKENVTSGGDQRSLGRVVTGEPYCMVRGVFASKYPGVSLLWALTAHLQVVSLPVGERCCYCGLAS